MVRDEEALAGQGNPFSETRSPASKTATEPVIGEEAEDLHTQYKMYNLTVEALLKHGLCSRYLHDTDHIDPYCRLNTAHCP